MTLTLVPPTPPSGGARTPHAVVRFVASLSGALDGLAGTPLWSMTPEEERAVLVELRRQRARLEELELRLLVQADRDGVGADSGATSTPAWLAHATRTTTSARYRDLHLAKKLDEPVRRDPGGVGGRADRRGEGRDHHRRGGGVDRGVRRPAGRDPGGGRGAPGRPGAGLRRPDVAAAGQAVVRGGLPGGGRRRRGRQAGEGGGQGAGVGALLGPRPRGRHQRGPVQAAHPARRPVEEGAGGADLTAADRGGPAGPGDREEAAARDAARARADGAGGEPPQ